MVTAQALDPPARVVPLRDRLAVRGGYQLLALPQEAAQAGVDEAGLRPRAGIALGGLDRLVDQREGLVGGLRGIPGQRQGGAQQGIGGRGRRALGQLPAQGLGAPEPAQHLEAQRLYPRPEGRRHGVEGHGAGNAAADRGQRDRGELQLAPERRPEGLRGMKRV
jgi:hypothetical protein